MTPELYAALFIGPLLEYARRVVRGATVPDAAHRELADGIWRALAS